MLLAPHESIRPPELHSPLRASERQRRVRGTGPATRDPDMRAPQGPAWFALGAELEPNSFRLAERVAAWVEFNTNLLLASGTDRGTIGASFGAWGRGCDRRSGSTISGMRGSRTPQCGPATLIDPPFRPEGTYRWDRRVVTGS